MSRRQHTGSAVKIGEAENVGGTAFGRVFKCALAQGWSHWRIASHGWSSHGRGDRNEGSGDDGREMHCGMFWVMEKCGFWMLWVV